MAEGASIVKLVLNRTGDYYEVNGRLFRRVTRITGSLPKQEFLIPWAMRLTADVAGRLFEERAYQTGAVFKDELLHQAHSERASKRNRGTEVHGAIDAFFRGQQVLSVYQPWVDMAESALEELGLHKAEFRTEVTFVHEELGYAGTCDLACDDGWLLDWKTGKLYWDYALQMWAYANATHYVLDGQLMEAPAYDRAFLVYLSKEGGIEAKQVDLENPRLGPTFEALMTVDEWVTSKEGVWL